MKDENWETPCPSREDKPIALVGMMGVNVVLAAHRHYRKMREKHEDRTPCLVNKPIDKPYSNLLNY